MGIPKDIKRHHVISAIDALRAAGSGGAETARKYELVFDGSAYAPKRVLEVAAEHATGKRLPLTDFRGGDGAGQANRVLRDLGFEIREKVHAPTPAYCVYVGSEGRANLVTARRHGVWGFDKESKSAGIENGTLVFIVQGFRNTGASSFPRCQPKQVNGQAELLLICQATSSIRHTNEQIWSDRAYPYQFSFRELGELHDVAITHESPLSALSNAMRLSGNSGGRAVEFDAAGIEEEIGVNVLSPSPPEIGEPEAGRWWVISAGRNGAWWPEFRRQNAIGLGWADIGNLSQYDNKDAILARLSDDATHDRTPTNDAHALFQFSREMEAGDFVIAKQGMRRLFGIGRVVSGYEYDPTRSPFPHRRRVEWLAIGNWQLPENCKVPLKSLTDVSEYDDVVDFAQDLLADTPETNGPGDVEPSGQAAEPYGLEDALEDLFLERHELDEIISRLRRKKNLILSGPPGVGKTFMSRRLAWLLIGAKDASRTRTVQFHQSYSYEDFVQGIRPTAAGGFRIKDGPFYEFCRAAEVRPDDPHVFIIDEINRGNLGKVFGELMMLIEADKRGPDFAITLTYSEASDLFSVPPNVYLIGMMNTADRSLSLVDYALRRRFGFVRLRPRFESSGFKAKLLDAGATTQLVDRIIERMRVVNEQILADKSNLGPGYEIGHSFFCPSDKATEGWYADVVRGEIEPLLDEYWWEDPEKVRALVAGLLE